MDYGRGSHYFWGYHSTQYECPWCGQEFDRQEDTIKHDAIASLQLLWEKRGITLTYSEATQLYGIIQS